jgi:hypothetical protein
MKDLYYIIECAYLLYYIIDIFDFRYIDIVTCCNR